MAIKDYVPSVKTVLAFVAGAGIVGAVALFVGGVAAEKEVFVPSKETCNKYIETRQGRFVCWIYGTNPVVGGGD